MNDASNDPWSVRQWGYHEPGVGYGFTMLVDDVNKPKPWSAFLAVVVAGVEKLDSWFATAEEARAAVDARAAEARAVRDAEVKK